MLKNRSIPDAIIIPELGYADLAAAVTWLCGAFGFAERLRIPGHRVQLTLGVGAAIVARDIAQPTASVTHEPPARPRAHDHSILVRVDDVDAHYARAREHGAVIVEEPTTHPYGERQYSAIDIGGHAWRFSQTVADVQPETWGGELVEASPP